MKLDIKICGLKTEEAVDKAVVLGASHIGFIFFPKSPRNIEPSDAGRLADRVRGRVKIVAVTVNADNATAHIFDAPIFTSTQTGNQIQTLTSVDKLTGTAATDDVLNAILNATEVTTKPTMSGVEKVNLTAIAASVFDAANSTGITEIGSVDSNNNLTVRNLAAGATVVVKNTAVGADTQVQFANAVASGTSDVATIKVDGVGRGALLGNAQVLNVRGETAGSFETLNIESTGGASRFASIGSDSTVGVGTAPGAATSLVKTVNVTGTANLRVDNALLNVTTVDANAFEGNLRVVLDNTKNVTVTGGKGADYFVFGYGLSNLDTVNGGDGRKTFVFRPCGAGQAIESARDPLQQTCLGQAGQDDPRCLNDVQIAGAQQALLPG